MAWETEPPIDDFVSTTYDAYLEKCIEADCVPIHRDKYTDVVLTGLRIHIEQNISEDKYIHFKINNIMVMIAKRDNKYYLQFKVDGL